MVAQCVSFSSNNVEECVLVTSLNARGVAYNWVSGWHSGLDVGLVIKRLCDSVSLGFDSWPGCSCLATWSKSFAFMCPVTKPYNLVPAKAGA